MSGNAAALTMSQAIPLRQRDSGAEPQLGWRDRLAQLDLVPDLGSNIGSAEWWRGLATLTLLCGTAIATFPGVQPLAVGAPALGRGTAAVHSRASSMGAATIADRPV